MCTRVVGTFLAFQVGGNQGECGKPKLSLTSFRKRDDLPGAAIEVIELGLVVVCVPIAVVVVLLGSGRVVCLVSGVGWLQLQGQRFGVIHRRCVIEVGTAAILLVSVQQFEDLWAPATIQRCIVHRLLVPGNYGGRGRILVRMHHVLMVISNAVQRVQYELLRDGMRHVRLLLQAQLEQNLMLDRLQSRVFLVTFANFALLFVLVRHWHSGEPILGSVMIVVLLVRRRSTRILQAELLRRGVQGATGTRQKGAIGLLLQLLLVAVVLVVCRGHSPIGHDVRILEYVRVPVASVLQIVVVVAILVLLVVVLEVTLLGRRTLDKQQHETHVAYRPPPASPLPTTDNNRKIFDKQ